MRTFLGYKTAVKRSNCRVNEIGRRRETVAMIAGQLNVACCCPETPLVLHRPSASVGTHVPVAAALAPLRVTRGRIPRQAQLNDFANRALKSNRISEPENSAATRSPAPPPPCVRSARRRKRFRYARSARICGCDRATVNFSPLAVTRALVLAP